MAAKDRSLDLVSKGLIAVAGLVILSRFLKRDTPGQGPGAAQPGSGTGEPGGRGPGVQVVADLTPLPPSVAVQMFRDAAKFELGLEDAQVLRNVGTMLAAHSAFETGQWQKMFNHNFGNITTGGARDFYTFEGDNHKYIAFPSFDVGVTAMTRLVLRKYQKALAEAKRGNPAGYAHELKVGGYYEGPEPQYTAGVVSLFDKFRQVL